MFKLLRGSKNRKSKKLSPELEVSRNSANQAKNEKQKIGVERYRLFSDTEYEKPTTLLIPTNVSLKINSRANVEEDLPALQIENANRPRVSVDLRVGEKNKHVCYSDHDDQDKYDKFDSNRRANEKVILAKTAASENTLTAKIETNSATAAKQNRKRFAFSKNNVEKINKIVSATALGVCADIDDEGKRGDCDRFGNGAADGDENVVGDVAGRSAMLRESSQNVDAEWQGHVVRSISKREGIEKSIEENKNITDHLKNQFNRKQETISTSNAKNAKEVFETDARKTTSSNCQNSRDTAKTADAVINEVKYRNLDKSNSESKRQSRLSLTLGLSLAGGKSKGKREKCPVSSRSETGSQVKRSFFRRKSKSVDSKEEFIDHSDVETPFYAKTNIVKKQKTEKKAKAKSKTEQTTAGDRTQRALEKSRTFLSDIFMARGRHQQRNRNPQQTQQQQQQQQQQEPTHPTTSKLQQEPSKYSAAQESSNIYNGNNSKDHNDHAINYQNDGKKSEENVAYHLETISNPLSTTTNSYQMTTSINSHGNVKKEHQQQQNIHSNSAQRVRCASVSSALTEESHAEHQNSGESKTNVFHCAHDDSKLLNRINVDEQQFIQTPNIKANGTKTANSSVIELKDQRGGEKYFESGGRERSTAKSNSTHERGINDKRQLNELTECDRDNFVLQSAAVNEHNIAKNYKRNNNNNKSNVLCLDSMGQTNAKSETPPSSRASTPREFRESVVPSERSSNWCERAEIVVPKITVVDYSDSGSSGNGSPLEQEVYYDFEIEKHEARLNGGVNITAVEEDDDGIEDDVFHEPDSKPNKRISPLRHNYARLEDVPEQDEEDNGEIGVHKTKNKHGVDDLNLDNELCSESPERIPSKSTNTSDSNLSAGCPDSGIGDSQASASRLARFLLGDNELSPARSTRTMSPQQQHLPFVRDGYSTDCDETLLPCDDLDYVAEEGELNVPERLVCIESISLPDVVVESTASSASAIASVGSASSSTDMGGEQIININGATGNTMGNVHFIPIHVEGDNKITNTNASGGGQKRRSVDDSFIGTSGRNSPFKDRSQTTVEIVEDENDCAKMGKSNGCVVDAVAAEKLKRELVEQKSRFNVQLEDAHKNVQSLQGKISEMQMKIEKLEQELSLKAWNVERLQGELHAAHKDDEYVRKRLKSLEDEKNNLRLKCNENENEFKRRLEDLEQQYKELEDKYKHTQSLASSLQSQLMNAQKEANEWRDEVETIRAELEEQTRILKNALENSEAERKICQDKWQKQFEILRTQNMDREEALMTDCEWQLRQLKKQCKDKIDKTESERKKALESAEELERKMCRLQEQVDSFKIYQAEVKSMRSIIAEQENTIQSLVAQIELLKTDLRTANESLEEQIEAVRKIKYQCNNALYDKERQMIYRIDEVRNEAAAFWENKLYTEMTRLKNELESVFVDERRDALDKLQAEHIEELRALTTRYTANEEELRIELNELQERFEKKSEEFMELRAKSDNALLQTRMQLDRADREFQNAMCREEERREALEDSLRKEFEAEKQEMEEKFRERLRQIREEFEKELKISTKDMVQQHKKELETQKAKLQAEKDEAIQELIERHRKKLAAAEDQMQELELRHQRDLKDLKEDYDTDKTIMDKRDMSNANEIEQLHRKCRCLTNLFEEMRMRYERRDPRPEDLNEIKELRSRCESQEQDLYILTDRLRELQNKMMEMQENNSNQQTKRNNKAVKKPPPKTIPLTCDVIYEENEERESPPPEPLICPSTNVEDDEEEDDSEEDDDDDNEVIISLPAPNLGKHANSTHATTEDDSHMITTV